MQWHDMRQYHKGKNLGGHDMFTVPLPKDDDGLVGRECSQDQCQPRYFKIAPREVAPGATNDEQTTDEQTTLYTAVDDDLYCPYCGYRARFQEFVTHDQLRWVKSLVIRDAHRSIQNMLRRGFRSSASSRSGPFSIRLTYKPGSLPSVRYYAEKTLKRIVECDQCRCNYAVYGVSTFCPRCGQGNLHLHLRRSIETVEIILNVKSAVEEQGGNEAGYQLLGNCLEDCVSLFEGFLKVIYSHALRFTVTDDVYQRKLSELRNSFQNVSRAEGIIQSDLGWKLFDDTPQSEREFMELQFAKRHVITHNLGLVDERFRTQAQTWQATGQDVVIDPPDITRLLDLLERILRKSISSLEAAEATQL